MTEAQRISELADVPAWIEQDIESDQVQAIYEGGCESGAYMPAVTYYDARQTMAEHGDAVLDFIQEQVGELPRPSDEVSWSGLAVHYLSYAVELWASNIIAEHGEVEY
jgi:hypothetical protein